MEFRMKSLLPAVAAAALALGVGAASAEDTVKIGLIVPLTGGQASTGKQIDNAIKLYQQQNGATVAGKKVEILVKDDGAVPDNTKRLAQELIVNDKVNIIAGFGVTPAALAAAPLATQAKVPEVVMAAGTSIITERSPYIVRTSFTLAQSSTIMGDWAVKNGIKKVAALVSDYAPGADALNFFKQHFTAGGGEIVEEVKVPLANPDFAPFLQRARDANPDTLFVFVPASQAGTFAIAPLATQAKIPGVIMVSGTSAATERSPYLVRTSFTLAQSSTIIGDWAVKNGIRKVATLTTDYAPGNDALEFFRDHLVAGGGEIVEAVKVPLVNPDFAPFLQRIRDAKPDALFVFVPGGQGGNFMKQFAERGLDKAGIRVIGPGDVMDDDLMPGMPDAALGAITAHMYSAIHPSEVNKAFVRDYKAAFASRPGFVAVGGYDGMHLIYEALKKTGGATDGDALVGAMKGMAWESPRGPISIDPETRDIIQNIYIRKVEKVDGELYNVELQTFEAVKDPAKAKTGKPAGAK